MPISQHLVPFYRAKIPLPATEIALRLQVLFALSAISVHAGSQTLHPFPGLLQTSGLSDKGTLRATPSLSTSRESHLLGCRGWGLGRLILGSLSKMSDSVWHSVWDVFPCPPVLRVQGFCHCYVECAAGTAVATCLRCTVLSVKS